jgi:acetyltransferase-like isoleucine patch superfamily enzyme
MLTPPSRQPLVIGIDSSVHIQGQAGLIWPETTIVEPHCSVLLGAEARLIFGSKVTVYSGCRFRSRCGELSVSDDVSFGPNCVIYEWRAGGRIGAKSMLAAGVILSGVNHGMDPEAGPYRDQPAQALPIDIGCNVWIGMNSTVMPGVSIGDNTVIGAGSVVTRSIPAGVVAYGSPCRVIRLVGERLPATPASEGEG